MPHESPFDPNSPAEKLAKGEVVGTVRLAGETDFAGITVELQGEARTYNVQTDAEGKFRIAGVVPGTYDARMETRYFVADRQTITVPLGEGYEVPPVTLDARTATVTGSALIQKSAADSTGGVTVTLHKTGSIRGGVSAAPGAWQTQAQGADVETESGDDGAFTLEGVPAGVYEVNASTPETGDETVGEITVTGEETSVEIEPIVVRPVSGFFAIDNAGGYVTSPIVTLRLTGFNAATMRHDFSVDGTPGGCAFTVTKAFQAVDTATLALEGENHVCVAFVDAQGRSTAPLVESVFYDATPPSVFEVTLDDGAVYSRDLTVRLTIQAADMLSGIASMQAAYTTNVTAATPQDFSPLSNIALPAGDGPKTVYLRLVDNAGNASPVVMRTITVDSALNAVVAAHLEDELGRTAATDRQFVSLHLQGLTADVAEMIAASNNSFAGSIWTPVTNSVGWQLASGDGLKTVFVKVRDLAGNESGVLQASITLDQSGPDTPGISLFDIDADGAALTNTSVELLWGIPGAADLAGFELQRYVQGVDLGFETLALLGPGIDRFVDDVTATTGNAHHYRIRAYDALGNSSGWSIVVEAHPFNPIEAAFWINTESGLRYVFNPHPGTYSLRSTYQYEAFDGLSNLVELNTDVAYWDRVTAGGIIYNESLIVKTVNRDNTLAFQSEISLGLDSRAKMASGGRFVGLAQSTNGDLHFLMNGGVTNAAGFSYVRHSSDGTEVYRNHYQPEEAYLPRAGTLAMKPDGSPVGVFFSTDAVFSGFNLMLAEGLEGNLALTLISSLPTLTLANAGPALAVTDDGKMHVFYSVASAVYYAHNVTGAWNTSTFALSGIAPAAVRDGNDKLHVCYHNTGSTLYYANNVTGAWNTQVVATSARYCSIAVTAANAPIIAYGSSTVGSVLNLAEWNGGGFTLTPIYDDPINSTGYAPSLFIDAAGAYHIGWDPGSTGSLVYLTNRSGAFVVRPLDAGNAGLAQIDLLVDGRDQLHAIYNHTIGTEARYVRIAGSPVKKTQITAMVDPEAARIFYDGDRTLITYSVYNSITGTYDVDLATYQYGTWTTEYVGAGAYDGASLAVDANGKLHLAWYDVFNYDAYYATNAGGSWSVQLLDSAGDVGYESEVAVGPDGNPVVAYLDYDNARLKLARFDGAQWNFTTFAGYYSMGDFSLDTNGDAHIIANQTAYGDLMYITDRYGAWTTEAVSSQGVYPSLALGLDGTAHVAYFAWQPTYDLGYATNEGGTWRRTIIDTQGDTGFYPQVMIDAEDTPHILYRDDSNRRLKYALRVNGGWTSARLTSYLGSFDGAFAPDGTLTAIFNDASNGQYYMLTGFQGKLPARSIGVVSPW